MSLNMGGGSDYVILVGVLLMRPLPFSAALILGASSSVQATEALLFDGGGYNIEVLIGYLDDPVIAQVRFTPPGAKDWVRLPRGFCA
jgi:hypothetical protein